MPQSLGMEEPALANGFHHYPTFAFHITLLPESFQIAGSFHSAEDRKACLLNI